MTDEKNQSPEGDDPIAQAERIIDEAAAAAAESAEQAAAAAESEADSVAVEIEAARVEAAGHLADLQRLQAEYVNYRKRVERDREAIAQNATAKAVEALFPVLDDIAAARDHGDLAEGPFASIAEKLEAALGRLGWSSFGTVGEVFDPQHHEALMSQPSTEVTEPTVQHVAQPGHRIGDRVVRAARVIVAQPDEQD